MLVTALLIAMAFALMVGAMWHRAMQRVGLYACDWCGDEMDTLSVTMDGALCDPCLSMYERDGLELAAMEADAERAFGGDHSDQ